jgi:hypothetical protein
MVRRCRFHEYGRSIGHNGSAIRRMLIVLRIAHWPARSPVNRGIIRDTARLSAIISIGQRRIRIWQDGCSAGQGGVGISRRGVDTGRCGDSIAGWIDYLREL